MGPKFSSLKGVNSLILVGDQDQTPTFSDISDSTSKNREKRVKEIQTLMQNQSSVMKKVKSFDCSKIDDQREKVNPGMEIQEEFSESESESEEEVSQVENEYVSRKPTFTDYYNYYCNKTD